MDSKKKPQPKPKPAPPTDDASKVGRDRGIPFGNKSDARSSPRKEQKTWEEVEPDVLDDMTPG